MKHRRTTPLAKLRGALLLLTLIALFVSQSATAVTMRSITISAAITPLTALGAITGTVKAGQVLTAGAVSPSPATVTYKWQKATSVGGTYSDISGATSSTYTVAIGDQGTSISLFATGTGNYSGTATSNPTSIVPPLAVGDSVGGGIVFYVNGASAQGNILASTDTVKHGLIAATEDQSVGIQWAVTDYQGTLVPGGTGTDIGTGLANTNLIIAQNGAGRSHAAGLARAYTSGGYSDWYLPSLQEMIEIFYKISNFKDFEADAYWCSSGYDENTAVIGIISTSSTNSDSKARYHGIRAVRAF